MTTNHRQDSIGRRRVMRGATGIAAAAGIGAPAIVGAQAQVLKIGHLTPLTGFLGPIGEFAVMGVKLAVEEVNESGGVLGRASSAGRTVGPRRGLSAPRGPRRPPR